MKIMALDIGEKRIGVAKTDPLGIISQALTTIHCTSEKKDFESIFSLLKEYEVDKLVIGLPLERDGEVGIQATKILNLKGRLVKFLSGKGFDVEVVMWDESMTTKEAEEFLIEAKVRRAKRRDIIDKIAATFILESYLRSIS